MAFGGGTPADQVFDHGSPPINGVVPPPSAGTYAVDLPALPGLRAEVARCGRMHGLDTAATNDLILAVNELLTNVMRHGGGFGRMWLWPQDGWYYCRVADDGPGLPISLKELYETRPPVTAPTGRGLWLIWQFVQRVRIQSGPRGTVVTLALPIP
jgi:anti-sigma regulatory factor (Ser/Thr protein kinase)